MACSADSSRRNCALLSKWRIGEDESGGESSFPSKNSLQCELILKNSLPSCSRAAPALRLATNSGFGSPILCRRTACSPTTCSRATCSSIARSPPPIARHQRQAAIALESSDRMVRLVPTPAQVREGTVVACAHGRQATFGRQQAGECSRPATDAPGRDSQQ